MSLSEKTTLIFYSENREINEKFEALSFDLTYFSGYKVIFDRSLLLTYLAKYPRLLLFYVSKDLNNSQRLFIRKLAGEFPKLPIVLCANQKTALDAWKFDLLYFLPFPISNSEINAALKKHLRILNNNEEIPCRIKINGENYLIPPINILFCKADGNYTKIYLKHDGSYLVTYQLHEIESKLLPNWGIERVNRSYIINLRNIYRIGKGKIIFNHRNLELKASDNLIRKIQKLLTGYYK